VVNHVTFFPAGDEVWATFTDTGKITLLDSNNLTYTGHLTAWDNFNLREPELKGAYLDILGDLLGSIAVIVAAAIIAAPVGSAPTRSPGR
jgi:Co/Zn/Cd efflux system component